jgi:hypothetical protein
MTFSIRSGFHVTCGVFYQDFIRFSYQKLALESIFYYFDRQILGELAQLGIDHGQQGL